MGFRLLSQFSYTSTRPPRLRGPIALKLLVSDFVLCYLPFRWLSSFLHRLKYGWKASGDVSCPPLLDVVVGTADGQTSGCRVRGRRPLRDGPLFGRFEAEIARCRREGPERVRGADPEGQETARLSSRSFCEQGVEGGWHVGRLRQDEDERALQKPFPGHGREREVRHHPASLQLLQDHHGRAEGGGHLRGHIGQAPRRCHVEGGRGRHWRAFKEWRKEQDLLQG